jgi:hypothetical protein
VIEDAPPNLIAHHFTVFVSPEITCHVASISPMAAGLLHEDLANVDRALRVGGRSRSQARIKTNGRVWTACGRRAVSGRVLTVTRGDTTERQLWPNRAVNSTPATQGHVQVGLVWFTALPTIGQQLQQGNRQVLMKPCCCSSMSITGGSAASARATPRVAVGLQTACGFTSAGLRGDNKVDRGAGGDRGVGFGNRLHDGAGRYVRCLLGD